MLSPNSFPTGHEEKKDNLFTGLNQFEEKLQKFHFQNEKQRTECRQGVRFHELAYRHDRRISLAQVYGSRNNATWERCSYIQLCRGQVQQSVQLKIDVDVVLKMPFFNSILQDCLAICNLKSGAKVCSNSILSYLLDPKVIKRGRHENTFFSRFGNANILRQIGIIEGSDVGDANLQGRLQQYEVAVSIINKKKINIEIKFGFLEGHDARGQVEQVIFYTQAGDKEFPKRNVILSLNLDLQETVSQAAVTCENMEGLSTAVSVRLQEFFRNFSQGEYLAIVDVDPLPCTAVFGKQPSFKLGPGIIYYFDPSKGIRSYRQEAPQEQPISASPKFSTPPSQAQSFPNEACVKKDEKEQKGNEDLELIATRKSARRFLGYGCDRTKGYAELCQTVLRQDFPDDAVNINNQESIKKHFIGKSCDEMLMILRESHESKFGVNFFNCIYKKLFGKMLGISRAHDQVNVTTKINKEIVCTAFVLRSARCSFKEIPEIERGKRWRDVSVGGDCFVRAGLVYVGYRVSFIMHIKAGDAIDRSERDVRLGIGKLQAIGFVTRDEDFRAVFHGNQIVDITVDVAGCGGYAPPLDIARFQTFNDAVSSLTKIDEDFSCKLTNLQNREYYIDPQTDVSEYPAEAPEINKLPQVTILEKANHSMISSLMPNLGNPRVPTLNDLARKIQSTLSLEEKRIMKDIDLHFMLETISTTFANLSAGFNQHAGQRKIIFVLGKTGVGKSTIIGHILGYKLQAQNYDGRNVLDYTEKHSILECPTIGHKVAISQTKGCVLYAKSDHEFEYVDCAGMLDSVGIEADICNAMSVAMMAKHAPPAKIIIVLSSSDIKECRAKGFLNLIDRLSLCIPDPTNAKIWPAILFIINDHETIINQETRLPMDAAEHKKLILRYIASAEKELDEEYHRASQSVPVQKVREFWDKGWDATSIAEQEERPESLAEQKALEGYEKLMHRLCHLKEQKEILSLFYKYTNNLIVADLSRSDDATKKIIFTLLRQPPFLDRTIFAPEHLYEDRICCLAAKFYTVLSILVSYFNGVKNRQRACTSLMARIKTEREKNHRDNARLQECKAKLSERDGSFLIKRHAEEDLARVEKEIDEKKQEECQKGADQKDIEKQISQLCADESPVALPDIGPTRAIAKRSFWSWWSPPSYKFTYEGISFLQIAQKRGEGEFSVCRNDPIKGEYEAEYTPAWWGYSNDCEAKIIVSVRTKDHPATKAKIRELRERLQIVNADLKRLQPTIQGLLVNRERLQESIAKKREIAEEREIIMKEEKRLHEEKERVSSEEKRLEEQIVSVDSEISSYRDFLQVLVNVIVSSNLDKSTNAQEQALFAQFISEYKTLVSSVPNLSASAKPFIPSFPSSSSAGAMMNPIPSSFWSSSSSASSSFPVTAPISCYTKVFAAYHFRPQQQALVTEGALCWQVSQRPDKNIFLMQFEKTKPPFPPKCLAVWRRSAYIQKNQVDKFMQRVCLELSVDVVLTEIFFRHIWEQRVYMQDALGNNKGMQRDIQNIEQTPTSLGRLKYERLSLSTKEGGLVLEITFAFAAKECAEAKKVRFSAGDSYEKEVVVALILKQSDRTQERNKKIYQECASISDLQMAVGRRLQEFTNAFVGGEYLALQTAEPLLHLAAERSGRYEVCDLGNGIKYLFLHTRVEVEQEEKAESAATSSASSSSLPPLTTQAIRRGVNRFQRATNFPIASPSANNGARSQQHGTSRVQQLFGGGEATAAAPSQSDLFSFDSVI